MITWETVRPGLLALILELAGLQTDYQDKRRSFTDPREQARVLLKVRSEDSIGIDDRRVRDTMAPIPEPNLVFSQNGHRRMFLDIRVESFRHDDDRFAFVALGKVRTALDYPSTLQRLRDLNIAIIRKGRTTDIPNIIQDQRITSAAVLELELNLGICTEDLDHPVPCIATVNPPIGTYNT